VRTELIRLFLWSTGRELNPRILVLQTSALATSPPVPITAARPPGSQRLFEMRLLLPTSVEPRYASTALQS
jgi:hypothetical protein